MTELAWIAEARKHIGLSEKTTTGNATILSWLKELGGAWLGTDASKFAWCGVFIAHCLKSVNVSYPQNWFRALDYAKSGVKLTKPCYGCVAVKSRTGGGHVTFVVGQTKDGRLVCLGGNQSDKVCFAIYNQSDFSVFMWYSKEAQPDNSRYNLPILTNVTATGVTEA